MSDSFSELRAQAGPTRAWTITAIVVLLVAALAAMTAAAYSLSRPERREGVAPSVVTVTAQPSSGPTPDPEGYQVTPATYRGFLVATGPAGQKRRDAILTVAGTSAMLVAEPTCPMVLEMSGEGAWTGEVLNPRCATKRGTWTLEESAPGVVEVRMNGENGASEEGVFARED